MTGKLSRRDALQTFALAGAGAVIGAPSRRHCPSRAGGSSRARCDAEVRRGWQGGAGRGGDGRDRSAPSLYEGAFGPRCVGAAAKMSPDTVFRIASMVKLLTSVAAMQLVERGKLKLDEPAEQIDPELASPPVLTGFDERARRNCAPARKPLTLAQSAHTYVGLHLSAYGTPDVVRYLKCCNTDKKLPRKPLTFDPEAKWAYGGSIDKVGRLVEIASGMPLDRYFQDYITGPLGMHNTCFNLTDQPAGARGGVHRRNADGSLKPEPPEKPVVAKVFLGGGGIYSTAPDYLTLLQALLNGGSLRGAAILRPETVALMSENQIGDLEAGVMKTTNPALSSDVDFFPGVRKRWGFGHMITARSRQGRTQGRKPDLGRSAQHLLLDRSGVGHRRRHDDADVALCRRTRAEALWPVRAWRLSCLQIGLSTRCIGAAGRSSRRFRACKTGFWR